MDKQKIIDNFWIDRVYIFEYGTYYKLHEIENSNIFCWVDLDISGGYIYDKNGIVKGTAKEMLEFAKENLYDFDRFTDFINFAYNKLNN